MASNLVFRPALRSDASDLALLFDAASRRLMSWLWAKPPLPGQSWFEVGRTAIREDVASGSHFTNWQVALWNQEVAGGLCSYTITAPASSQDTAPALSTMQPFDELNAIARGTHYISVASVFPEHRGKGIGTAILHRAADIARLSRAQQLSLIVESFNPDAMRLYQRSGFGEVARRRFVPFPGCRDRGDLILMVKAVTA